MTASAYTGWVRLVPQWWMPEAFASFELTAPIVDRGDAQGRFLAVSMQYDQGAYLSAAQHDVLDRAFGRNPGAVLMTIEHGSDEIFLYNVAQPDKPWPVPVLLLAPKHAAVVQIAISQGAAITVSVKGSYQRDVAARNIVGRVDRGAARTIVVSTPVTSWFTSTGERAPGIACLLALARHAPSRWMNCNVVFVATSGHEIGHEGMEQFISHEAPRPSDTVSWIHLGASLACYQWDHNGTQWNVRKRVDGLKRVFLRSNSLERVTDKAFAGLNGWFATGDAAAIGELREVHRAGYAHFAGSAGMHQFFHTRMDSALVTGPEVLEPVLHAFETVLDDIDSGSS